MKKRLLSLALALSFCLGLAGPALAAEEPLPDWYFLFAIFKKVDADVKDRDGKVTHQTYTMPQEEIDLLRDIARDFEAYMTSTGVMRAHVDVVEIDTPVTELFHPDDGSSRLYAEQAAPLLEAKADLDRYDHVTCILNLNVSTGWAGLAVSAFENGTGLSNINHQNWEYFQNSFLTYEKNWVPQAYVHEFLHFMEFHSGKWGLEFKLHDTRINFYSPDKDNGKECYTAIIQNRAKGNAGTGVHPAVWKYPPHVRRTMSSLTIPDGVASIGSYAFEKTPSLTSIAIAGSVATMEYGAFQDCTSLTDATMHSGLASIGDWAFGRCPALTRVSLPASVTSIGYAAFWDTGVKDVYYTGTEAQWKAIQIGDYNQTLTGARIHYNHLMADVKTTDYFAQPVAWALENGVTAGTGGGRFSPGSTCTQAQILTFLWRAKGSPQPAKAVTGNYYAAALQWAAEQGITGPGVSPDAPCTRAGAVTYLWKLAGSPAASGGKFTDVPTEADYAQAVAWAVRKGITAGTSAATFRPDSTCTRGQIVTFLYRDLAQ